MTLPDRIYAIGDIHGQLEKLRAVHDAIAADLTGHDGTHAVVHIGDYIDRGPDSRGVVQFLIEGQAAGHPWVCLLGNHDRMLTAFLVRPGGRDPRLRSEIHWLDKRLGGVDTLRSYGLDLPDTVSEAESARLFEAARAAVPPAHVEFLTNLPDRYQWRDFFFAHAGIQPGVPLSEQVTDDLIWIRKPFHDSTADHGATVVYGHTPVKEVEDHGNRIAIDTGAAYGGPLSCVVFTPERVDVLGGARLR